VNNNTLEKFIKDVKKFQIELDHQIPSSPSEKIKYDLIYEVYEYELLLNQNKTYIKRLRKNKIPVKVFKKRVIDENGRKHYKTYYYKLYSYKRMTNQYIDKRVESILNKEIVVDKICTNNKIFISDQIAKRVHKTKSDSLNGEYEKIFDIIGLYLSIKRHNKNEKYTWNIPDEKPKKEISFDELLEKHKQKKIKKFEKKKIQKNKHEKWIARHQGQVNRWGKSKTSALNKLYLQDDFKEYWSRFGLFDPSKPTISNWSIIDTENKFSFNNQLYKIDESLEQYKVYDDNAAGMEKILCFYVPNEDRYYFFDENIVPIKNELIQSF
jgi:hypothetical protein